MNAALLTHERKIEIIELENRLNIKLLYRSTRKVTLTEEGKVYYKHTYKLVKNLQIAEEEIFNLKSKPTGLIKITAPVTYGEQHILPLLNSFLKINPDLKDLYKKIEMHY